MSSIQKFQQITLTDVFNQFSIGLNSSVVVTPNRRLATVLRRDFNSYQVTQGRIVWSTPDILPITAFIERAYEEMLYSEQADKLPTLLSTAQEQALWENILSDSDRIPVLFAVPEAAKLAREAWQIIHEWQLTSKLRNFPLNDDCKVFRDWSKSYKSLTRRAKQIDKARICDLIVELWKHTRIKKPNRLICHGFDTFTPQQKSLLDKLSEGGCEILITQSQSQLKLRRGDVKCISCIDNRDEIYHAAVWARKNIESDSTVRVGVVVQDLTKYRSEIMHIFGSVMEPDVLQILPGSLRRILPFNVSLGLPLLSYSLVNTAFQILGLAGKDIEFEFLSNILRSPFLVGGQAEMTNRALLDEQLRKRAEPRITLDHLLVLIKRTHSGINCPVFLQQILSLSKFRKENLFGMLTPSELARAISETLQIFGFPGDRVLDSSEHQILKKWHKLIADFAALDRVIAQIGYIDGVSYLRHMAAETIFQSETPDVPIQILGMFESAGMEFDHLWVMGLSDTEWPLSPRTNSFLPVELQRSVKLPRGSASESLELARRFIKEWRYSSDEVIFSYPKHSDKCNDSKLTPSPLIINTTQDELTLPTYKSHRDLIYQARQIECSEDNIAPKLDHQVEIENCVSGGAAVIKDQAACPFRAFALHRLGARGIKSPHTGLDAMERGILVHSVLAQAWRQFKSKGVLDAISYNDLEVMLSNVAKEAVAIIQSDRSIKFSKHFVKIEHQRLVRLTLEWLNKEKKRGDFRVIAIEDKRDIKLGGLTLTTRLDRVDKLNDGRLVIIDYKTGVSTVSSMRGERPDEPQLPLYLVTSEPNAIAVVFAQVKTGSMKFNALVRDSDILPGIKADPEWKELVSSWRTDLTRIAASFSEGDARVNPKKYPETCRNCDLQSFCRIYELKENTSTEQEDNL